MFDDPRPPGQASPPAATTSAVDAPISPAVQKFHSCRWRRAPENGSTVDCCSHRDVLPIAGTTGFDPAAWCPDCTFFKLRRTPKKREPGEYRY